MREAAAGAVVFDLDGTLVDTSEDIAAGVNHVRARCGLAPLAKAAVLSCVGHGAANLVARTTGVTAEAGARFAELLAEFRRAFRENQGGRSRLYPGIRELLDDLAADFDLYVLSNKPHEATLAEVAAQGIGGAFRAIWGGGHFGALKPDPIGVVAALRASGVGRERGAMVGDLLVDAQTGLAAGVPTFVVAWGFAGGAVDAPPPCVRVATPAGLVAGLRRALPARR